MKRVVSGIQPSGNLHIGNYLGAVKNWVKQQDEAEEFYFFIADLHALTMHPNPQEFKSSLYETTAAFIAAGINPKKFNIFPQSAVHAHAELGWILNCFAPLGWLNRMTQFKDKAGKDKEKANAGLYTYPVLQAADVLIYKGTHVPVGEDQKQHLELMRDVAGAFNRFYQQDYFPLPEPQIPKEAPRIMSLRDGKKKMSKSDASDYSRITLMDDADTILQKIKKATTDPHPLPDSLEDLKERAEADNLITIYAAFADTTKEKVVKDFAGQNFSSFKTSLADLLSAKLTPITAEMRKLVADKGHLDKVLRAGADKANALASKHISEIKEIIGFWSS